ncbi:MAG: FecR domain-containing protein [Candidatus Omnitrophica bacterium]|nr:FecR domain-containing protein [Candidatus Omnitrophota bacterium]
MAKQLSSEDQKLLDLAFRTLKTALVPETPHFSMSEILKGASQHAFPFGWVSLSIAFVFIIAFGFLVLPQISKVNVEAPKSIPTSSVVQSVSGTVMVKQNGAETVAKTGTFLEEKAMLKTQPAADIYLRAGEDLSFMIKENSEVRIDKLRLTPETQEKDIIFSVNYGHILCRLDHALLATKLQVVTPEASFRVTGTQFELTRNEQGSELNVYEGTILATPADRAMEPVSIEKGFQAKIPVKKSGKTLTIKPLTKSSSSELEGTQGTEQAQTGESAPTTSKQLPPIDDYYEEK